MSDRPADSPSIAALLADPTASRALKTVLRAWATRDPVDAVHDAEALARAFGERASDLFGDRL